ncbi:MAG: aminotransferase class III-fold pyridoxal phosphate-dependent enzyme [Calothrix sp. MO_167.B12]|nr:aminotransferase class III-fold pyridoxal phosphate-dependent enzyme [Calothrix sp. MO_167.B12]
MSYPVWHPFTNMGEFLEDPLILTKGEGINLYDEQGNCYLDLNACLWSLSLGYGREDIIEAMMDQAKKIACLPLFGRSHQAAVDYAEKLLGYLNGDFSKIFYTSGGSEAIETALKISRAYHCVTGNPQKTQVGHFSNSYHGVSLGALSIMGIPSIRKNVGPVPTDSFEIPMSYDISQENWEDYVEKIEQCILAQDVKTVAAIVIEPVIAAGGIIPIPSQLIRRLKQFCITHNILLILDEIVTGYGRTGYLFAYQEIGIVPDLITVAKAITSGYAPLGGVLVTAKIADLFMTGDVTLNHGFTHGGHPIACAAASKTLDILHSEGILNHIQDNTDYFSQQMQTLDDEFEIVEQVKGCGYMYGVKLVDQHDAANLAPFARKYGLLFRRPAENNVIPVVPPLVSTRQDIDNIVTRLRTIITEYLLAI